jgi:hypothetical protein
MSQARALKKQVAQAAIHRKYRLICIFYCRIPKTVLLNLLLRREIVASRTFVHSFCMYKSARSCYKDARFKMSDLRL